MSPRGQRQNEQMRAEALEKITMAALMVFAEYGYHGATMKKITEATDLSYGLVYHYFPSKEKIFRHLIDSSFDASRTAAEMVLKSPGSAWEKIEQLSAFLVRETLTGDSSPYFLIVLHALTQTKSIPGFLDHVTEKIEEYYQVLAPFIAEAQETGEVMDGDPTVLAAAYFSFLQGLALMGVQKNELTRKVTPEMLINVLRKAE